VELDTETGQLIQSIQFEDMFTKNQLLNKENCSLKGLLPAEITQKKKKKF
jgi:hypothetical protein